jgi:sulfopyruvate decarboxylase TPP-binding subunit
MIVAEEDAFTGASVLDALAESGIEYIVALPDLTTSETVLRRIYDDRRFKLVRVCKEDEGISICTGLSYCDKRAALLIQYTGLFDSLNSVRAIAVRYKHPVVMLCGMVEKEGRMPPSESRLYSTRIIEPVLDAMEVEHHWIEAAETVAKIGPAIDKAYATSLPVAFLLGKPGS